MEKITPDTAETMLMGTTRNVISPNGLEKLKSNYGISRIQQKGGDKYEIKFKDERSRNLAWELGYLATAGLKNKLYNSV